MKGRFFLDAGTLFAAGRRGVMICLAGAVFGVLFNAVSPRGIDLLGPVPHREAKGIGELGLEEAWALHKERTGVFVDARSAEEFACGTYPRGVAAASGRLRRGGVLLEGSDPSRDPADYLLCRRRLRFQFGCGGVAEGGGLFPGKGLLRWVGAVEGRRIPGGKGRTDGEGAGGERRCCNRTGRSLGRREGEPWSQARIPASTG